jgi:hypothetical protein
MREVGLDGMVALVAAAVRVPLRLVGLRLLRQQRREPS